MKTFTKTTSVFALFAALSLTLTGCGESENGNEQSTGSDTPAHAEDTHVHADGTTHADHAEDQPVDEMDHAHDEVALDPITIGDMTVELAQGHGSVAAGKEGHLVVKLPYSDNGATIVRAWIGTEDRTLSYVGRGDYAASHDDYDIHAIAPTPLPENAMWWIEIEKPDGTKLVGSATPITK
ncbi:MAG: hypothetical protein ACF8NJ_04305 [Phycisphaerales bacterium JB038]